MTLLPEGGEQLAEAALQRQKNDQDGHSGKTGDSNVHPEQDRDRDGLQRADPQEVQEYRYLRRTRQGLLRTTGKQNQRKTQDRNNLLQPGRTDGNLDRNDPDGF